MAAQYTEVTLEDMDKFLRRAYRALRPKRGEDKGEVYYDLNLSDNKIFVRVWTSIGSGRSVGARKGADAIRVTLITRGGKPLMPKSKIVKRTQGWKGSLQDRIEDLLETYESKTLYWKDRQKSRDEGSQETSPAAPTPAPPSGGVYEGTFTKGDSGNWMARVEGSPSPGDKARLVTKATRSVVVTLDRKVWGGRDRRTGKYVEIWSFHTQGKTAATDEHGNVVDLAEILVVERMLG